MREARNNLPPIAFLQPKTARRKFEWRRPL